MSTVTENYPGELEMLRGLVRTLRTVVRENDTLPEVRRLLWEQASDEGAAYAEATEKSSRPAADATADPKATGPALKWPDDWDEVLDTAIRAEGGEWQPKRVQQLYLVRYGRGLYRSNARQFLSKRAHAGLLTLHDRPNGRFYTLNARKDGRS
ncbi:hypothetical protein ABT063_24585 [Streptomyces sp. NPDC002838]|uniref:hypothetical protein n=1 Tax=Streptomyces sp. NPDC002838 TaxID=3154436 RepID=UPI00332733CE